MGVVLVEETHPQEGMRGCPPASLLDKSTGPLEHQQVSTEVPTPFGAGRCGTETEFALLVEM